MAIKVTLQADGSLLFQANNETRSDLARALDEGWQRADGEFIELVRGAYIHNGGRNLGGIHYNLDWLNPADIFALSDMPMLADNCRDDDDALRVYGAVWGFPEYETRDHLRELANTGRTVFVKVADYGAGMTFPSRHADKAQAEFLARRAYENCLDPVYVTEAVSDLHGEPGDTIARLVDIATRPPAPVTRDLFA